MAEYASKGVAGTALGLGIAGTTLGVLSGNGGLGGILGGGNNSQVSALQSENAMLKAQKYSDQNAKEVYGQSLADNRLLRTELYQRIDPLTAAVVDNAKNIATLEAKVDCNAKLAEKDQQIMVGKINELGLVSKGRFECLDQIIAGLAKTVDEITMKKIPNSAVCPGWGPVCTQPAPCPRGTSEM